MATRYPQIVHVKLATDVVEMARLQAEADDRPLGAYLRRLITDAVEAAQIEGKNKHGQQPQAAI